MVVMCATSAAANTSPGAPWVRWVVSVCVLAKLNVMTMLLVPCSLWPMLSKAGCREAAANTVRVVRAGPVEVVAVGPQAATRIIAPRVAAVLITPELHADVGGLDDGHSRHSRLQAELVYCLAGEQRHQPVRSGLDLDLGRDPVLHDTGDDAGKVVASGLRDHHRGRLLPCGLGQERQRGAVNQPLPARAARRPQPPVVHH